MSPVFTWFPLYHLPPVPESYADHITRSLDQAGHMPRDDYFEKKWASRQKFHGRTLTLADGRQMRSLPADHMAMPASWRPWAEDNITKNIIESSVRYTLPGTDSDHWGAHCDIQKVYKFFYIIKDGGPDCVTTWYQEQGKPLCRESETRDFEHMVHCTDYARLTVIDSARLPVKQWIFFNTQILHGVENISEMRASIQISVPWKIDCLKSASQA